MLVVYRKIIDFYILALYPATLLNSLIVIMLVTATTAVAAVIKIINIIKGYI